MRRERSCGMMRYERGHDTCGAALKGKVLNGLMRNVSRFGHRYRVSLTDIK